MNDYTTRLAMYENEKAHLQREQLSAEEYQRRLREIADRWRV